MELAGTDYNYVGMKIEPAVTVTCGETVLRAGKDYTVTYGDDTHDNYSTGEKGIVIITGKGTYEGLSLSKTFTINKAPLEICAENREIGRGDTLPTLAVTADLCGNDVLEASAGAAVCSPDTEGGLYKIGNYDIDVNPAGIRILTADGTDAAANYNITYKKGTLTVTKGSNWNSITYEMNGHGTAPVEETYLSVETGHMIPKYTPACTGFTFEGWYTDSALTKVWDSLSDTVQSNMVLYAKWSENCGDRFRVILPRDVTYTGGAIKPNVSVYFEAAFGPVELLQVKKNYTVKYYNNVNVNTTPVQGRGVGADFDADLPYVEITGVGNYSGTQKVNFNIVPASISDGEQLATGFSLKYYPLLKVSAKNQPAFASLKKGKATLAQNRDLTVILKSVDAYDQNGDAVAAGQSMEQAVVPAGYYGTYELIMSGCGNYSGELTREIQVEDPSRNLSSAAVAIAKAKRKVPYTGSQIRLPISAFTVKAGKVALKYGTDYTLSYRDNIAVGTATVTVNGIGAYHGSKEATFQITGTALTGKNLDVANFPGSVTYTGRAQVVDNTNVSFIKPDKTRVALKYGQDFIVTYSKNVNAGVATVQYTGLARSGYTGTVKKNFRILPASIAEHPMNPEQDLVWHNHSGASAAYSPKGARIDGSFLIQNKVSLDYLQQGKDFTVSYENNKKPTTSENMARAIVKGKGNYCGMAVHEFNITASLTNANVKVTAQPIKYNPGKDPESYYRPGVSVTIDGVKVKANEYDVVYNGTKQSDLNALRDSILYGAYASTPSVTIVPRPSSIFESYSTPTVEIPVVNIGTQLTAKNTYMVCEEAYYDGNTKTPEVKVYYIDTVSAAAAGYTVSAIQARLQGLTDNDEILAAGMGFVSKLTKNAHYYINYGTNVTAGKNKGTYTITGILSNGYYGSATGKFTIYGQNVNFTPR